MDINSKLDDFRDKVKKIEKSEKLDLSSDEDLSIAVMNLIAIEEHLFFSGGKTGKTEYFDLLNEVRQMRKSLLKMLIKKYEGEVWCISKHLLSASMRLMEVGTKALTKDEKEKAHDFFKKSYDLYNLFWGLNLGIIKREELSKINFDKNEKPIKLESKSSESEDKSSGSEGKNFLGKLSSLIGKIVDCCKE